MWQPRWGQRRAGRHQREGGRRHWETAALRRGGLGPGEMPGSRARQSGRGLRSRVLLGIHTPVPVAGGGKLPLDLSGLRPAPTEDGRSTPPITRPSRPRVTPVTVHGTGVVWAPPKLPPEWGQRDEGQAWPSTQSPSSPQTLTTRPVQIQSSLPLQSPGAQEQSPWGPRAPAGNTCLTPAVYLRPAHSPASLHVSPSATQGQAPTPASSSQRLGRQQRTALPRAGGARGGMPGVGTAGTELPRPGPGNALYWLPGAGERDRKWAQSGPGHGHGGARCRAGPGRGFPEQRREGWPQRTAAGSPPRGGGGTWARVAGQRPRLLAGSEGEGGCRWAPPGERLPGSPWQGRRLAHHALHFRACS